MTQHKIEYLLWYKDDDLGWYISKRSMKLEDFDAQDRWYFNHIIEHDCDMIRVGGAQYHLNYMKAS